jgi:hypothetical protein
LRIHPWNFAKTRVGLAANAVGPEWGFDNAYTLPVDCLRLLEPSNDGNLQYIVEGRNIITDIGAPLNIIYIKQVTDVSVMDVAFRNALAAALALDVAESFTGTAAKVDQAAAIYKQRLIDARFPDGQEGSPSHVESSEWLEARSASGFDRGPPSGPGTPL